MTTTTEPTTTGRPPAPEGRIYLSDILAVIREHANGEGWCSDAEELTCAAFELGSARWTDVFERYKVFCCEDCHGDRATFMRNERVKRFTLRRDPDRTVTVGQLKDAIRYARRRVRGSSYELLYRTLANKYGVARELGY